MSSEGSILIHSPHTTEPHTHSHKCAHGHDNSHDHSEQDSTHHEHTHHDHCNHDHDHDHDHNHDHGHGHGHHHHHHHHFQAVEIKWILDYFWKGKSLKNGKYLVIFTLYLMISSTYQVMQGSFKSDHHLIAEGFHCSLHALCVMFAIVGMVYSEMHKVPDKEATFGGERAQVLSTFGNTVFLIFILGFSMFETIKSLFLDEKEGIENDLTAFWVCEIVIASLVTALYASKISNDEPNTSQDDSLAVIALHALSLATSDLILILTFRFNLEEAQSPLNLIDPILRLIWGVALFFLTRPFFIKTGRVLLLCSPEGKSKDNLGKLFREVQILDGVVGIQEEKFWRLTNSKIVGSITLRVHEDCNVRKVVEKVRELLSPVVYNLTVEVVCDKLDS